jgi:hypothetical protein
VPATQFPAQILINWPAKHAEENLSRNLFQQKFTRLDHLELLPPLESLVFLTSPMPLGTLNRCVRGKTPGSHNHHGF